ncbi:unnamed protein product [Cylindrotheca closterium]|uniref:Uncharacterized protein n=1 Tax=Cylindrotheca closterium TaxID=2856 RepID=A0AAD2FU13_9STRA|nr:unnamed protein product [Cylindrotheca closterium]
MRTLSRNATTGLGRSANGFAIKSGVEKRSFSGKQLGKNAGKSKPRLKTASIDVNSAWYSSTRANPGSLEMGRYGLKRLDYRTMETPVWSIPPHPPTKSTSDRVVFPITLLTIGSIIVWAYLNPEDEDMKDYWKRVETGQILEDDDEDDEDED